MKNQAMYVTVRRAIYGALHGPAHGPMDGDVYLAVDRTVDRAAYLAVVWAVRESIAQHEESPPPGLGIYLGGVAECRN